MRVRRESLSGTGIKQYLSNLETVEGRLGKAETIFFLTEKSQPIKEDLVLTWLTDEIQLLMKNGSYHTDLEPMLQLLTKFLDSKRYAALVSNGFCSSLPLSFIDCLMEIITIEDVPAKAQHYGHIAVLSLFRINKNSVQLSKLTELGSVASVKIAHDLQSNLSIEKLSLLETIASSVTNESAEIRQTFENSINDNILYSIMLLNISNDSSTYTDEIKSKIGTLQDHLLELVHKDKRDTLGADLDNYLLKSFEKFVGKCKEGPVDSIKPLIYSYLNSIKQYYPKAFLTYYKLVRLSTSMETKGSKKEGHYLAFIQASLDFLITQDMDFKLEVENEKLEQWLHELGLGLLNMEVLSNEVVECLRMILKILPGFIDEDSLVDKFVSLGCKSNVPSATYCGFMEDLTSLYCKRQLIHLFVETIVKSLIKNKEILPSKSIPLPHANCAESSILPESMLTLIKNNIKLFGASMAFHLWSKITSLLEICDNELQNCGNESVTLNAVAYSIWFLSLCLSSPTAQTLYNQKPSVQEAINKWRALADNFIVPLFRKVTKSTQNDNICASVLFLTHRWAEVQSELLRCIPGNDSEDFIHNHWKIEGLNDFSLQCPLIGHSDWESFFANLSQEVPSTKLAKIMLVIQKHFLLRSFALKIEYTKGSDIQPPRKKQKTDNPKASLENIEQHLRKSQTECEDFISQIFVQHEDASTNEISLLSHHLPSFASSFKEQNINSIAKWFWHYMQEQSSSDAMIASSSVLLDDQNFVKFMVKTLCGQLLKCSENPHNVKNPSTAEAVLTEISTSSTEYKLKKLATYMRYDKISSFKASEVSSLVPRFTILKNSLALTNLLSPMTSDYIMLCFILLKENVPSPIPDIGLDCLNGIFSSKDGNKILSLINPDSLLQYLVRKGIKGIQKIPSDDNTVSVACGNVYNAEEGAESAVLLVKYLTHQTVEVPPQSLSSYITSLSKLISGGSKNIFLKMCALILMFEMVKQDKVHTSTNNQIRESITNLSLAIQKQFADIKPEDNSVDVSLFLMSQIVLLAFRDPKANKKQHQKKKTKEAKPETKGPKLEEFDDIDSKSLQLGLKLAKNRLHSSEGEGLSIVREFIVRTALRSPEVWKEISVHDILANLDHSLARRIFSMSSVTEYSNFLDLQLKFTEEATESKDLVHSLNTWSTVIEKNSEGSRTLKLREVIQSLLTMLLVKMTNKESSRNFEVVTKVLKFFKMACQMLVLSHYSKSLALKLISLIKIESFKDQHYYEVVSCCLDLLGSFVSADKSVHPNHLHALMENVSRIIRDVIKNSDNDLHPSEESVKEYSTICDKVEKLSISITKRYNTHLSDLGCFEIGDIIMALQDTPPCPQIRTKTERILFHFMKKLAPSEIKYLMNSLRPSSVVLLKHLLSTFSDTILFDNFRRES